MKRILLLALLGVAACADPHASLSPDFGNAVQTNIDAQVVNPKPTLGLANTNGQRIENAARRYQTNSVYPPRPESGTTFGAGGSTTGGGGGGTPAAP
jgi:hypothetical protein